MQSARLFYC
ncbi:Protein of unknown function [Bacillus mycoides]|nr:Protein of unknown function [Bacillus mycoides]